MPATSVKQRKHLDRLNSLWQTEAHRFRPGGKPWNIKHRDLPRNKARQPLIPCRLCATAMVTVYSKTKTCRTCRYELRRKTDPRVWKSGYVYQTSGRYPEHIVIAERVLGRKLQPHEHVHHIDMDKTNNQNSNLLICDNSYHKWLHHAYAKEFARRCLSRPNQLSNDD